LHVCDVFVDAASSSAFIKPNTPVDGVYAGAESAGALAGAAEESGAGLVAIGCESPQPPRNAADPMAAAIVSIGLILRMCNSLFAVNHHAKHRNPAATPSRRILSG
jgi:hypothetical protein